MSVGSRPSTPDTRSKGTNEGPTIRRQESVLEEEEYGRPMKRGATAKKYW